MRVIDSIIREAVETSVNDFIGDDTYMDAVAKGDMKTARTMLLAAARKAMSSTKAVDGNGNPMVLYHSYDGDGYGPYLMWMSSDKAFSKEFGRNTDMVFVNMENPYVTPDDILRDQDGNEIVYGEDDDEPAYIGDLDAMPDEYIGWLEDNFDGVCDNNFTFTVTFGSGNIKSADTVTYDDNGDIIPLSQRFNFDIDNINY